MASRLSKRKRPRREDKPFKEATKIAERVFDDHTVQVLVNLLNTHEIESLDYPVSGGKEAILFRASSNKGFKAVKVFKYETSSFYKMFDYVQGDPRFYRPNRRRRPLVKLWASKEFANLKACCAAGVRVPEPYRNKDNVVTMQFLGVDGVQSALLCEVILEDPRKTFDSIIEETRKAYKKAGLVHADLSAFNIIIHEGEPWLIDWGQGVSVKHPRAGEFLKKDVHNIVKYFKRLGITDSEEEVLELITK